MRHQAGSEAELPRIHSAGIQFRRQSVIFPTWALLVCLPFSGCGQSGPPRSAVSGTVQLDGAPVAEGMIQFDPAVGTVGVPVQMPIKEGKFSAPTDSGPAVGANSVVITASKKTGKKIKSIMGDESDEVVQFIPAKYNKSTELNAEVKNGSNEFSFELSSK